MNETIFSPIAVASPEDAIIDQLISHINTGRLAPGERLPAERELAEQLGTSRTYVRKALGKLEVYGILKTSPQSGTVVSPMGLQAFEGLVSTAIRFSQDLEGMIETRSFLELHAVELAIKRGTPQDLDEIVACHRAFRDRVTAKEPSIEEDLAFHLRIAEAGKNRVLRSLLGLMVPDILALSRKSKSWIKGRDQESLREHEGILDAIISRNPRKAAETLGAHLDHALVHFQEISE